MNRVTAFLLAMMILATALFAGCSSETQTGTVEQTATLDHATEEKEDLLPNQLHVSDVESLPVATESMTYAERRQLCLDYFELQLSFQWLPDQDILDYPTTYATFAGGKTIEADGIYGGIPYQSTGTGNLYRWLEYYDEDTATFRFSQALSENGGYGEGAAVTGEKTDDQGNVTYKKYRSLMTFFNQCSVASFWGWGRVINSANFIWTADMNVYNGFIPVGCYTYPNAEKIDRFGEKTEGNPEKYDTRHVIEDWKAANGEEAMYQCYAQMKPADCLVSGGHTMMVKSVDLYTRPDGSTSYVLSEVTVIEQIEGWGYQGSLSGKKYTVQGGVDRVYTFAELEKSRYIPMTFAELLDPSDPQDKKHLDYYHSYADKLSPIAKRYTHFQFTQEELAEMTGIGVEKAVVFNTLEKTEGSISLSELTGMAIGSNYAISDLFVTVTDPNGNQLLKNVHRTTSAQIREVTMNSRKSTWEYDEAGEAITVSEGLAELATGENTVEISLQLSTGEKLVAFAGTFHA